jgi:hypothetical protein
VTRDADHPVGELPAELYSLEDRAARGGREVADGLGWFTLKTVGLRNWLEREIRVAYALE